MRLIVVVSVLLACAGGIASLFWKQELKYQLPTPVPAAYRPVALGSHVTPPLDLERRGALFLHFYNPDCPCSRFNVRHLKSLIRSYSDSVAIVVVVSSKSDEATARQEFGDSITTWVDAGGQLASRYGVYSTPQAVIISAAGTLYYRGNYNRSRYCTSRATNFAELSLIALLNDQPSPAFGLAATQSYGCELPTGTASDVELF
jgi:hypothetical protein